MSGASVVVRFLQAFDGFNVGDLDVMPSCLARVLVDAGVAVVVDVDEAERRRIMRAALSSEVRPAAKERQAHGMTAPGKTLVQNSEQASMERKVIGQLASAAGVSHDTPRGRR